MSELRKIFDNLDHVCDKWEPYFEIYEKHLGHLRGTKFNLVEVGVYKGGSLEIWSKYMGPDCNITGIDINQECLGITHKENNIRIVLGDQGNAYFWDMFLKEIPRIDVFIDDGGHSMQQQILTFEKVFPTMPVGSIFICEDCHTSYEPSCGLKNPDTFIEYAKSYIDVLHADWFLGTNPLGQSWPNRVPSSFNNLVTIGKDLSGVYFYDSVVVFEKFGQRKMERLIHTP